MGLINGGLINPSNQGGSSSASQLALSDGLACFTGSFSGVTTTQISHGLGTTDLVVEFVDSGGNLLLPDTWSIINSNVIEVEFTPAATGNVTIIGCIASGLAPVQGGVTILEGLSGIIDLDSPNGSIVISTSGQVINLNAIFTPASGAILEQKCRDIDTLSGLIGTGGGGSVSGNACATIAFTPSSGTEFVVQHDLGTEDFAFELYDTSVTPRQFTLPQNIAPSGSNHAIVQLDQPITGRLVLISCGGSGLGVGSSAFPPASGAIIDQNREDIITLSGLTGTGSASENTCSTLIFTPSSGTEFVVQHDLGTEDFTFELYDISVTPRQFTLPQNIAPSGNNHAIVQLDQPINGRLVLVSCGGSGTGIQQADPGNHVDQRQASGSIIPDTSGLYDLGAPTLPWRAIYAVSGLFSHVEVTDSLTISGQAIATQNDIPNITGGRRLPFTPTSGTSFVLEHGLNTQVIVWSMFTTDTFPENILTPANVAVSGINHVIVELAVPVSGALNIIGISV